ncbi:paraquat-inducible protein B [Photobacterium aphoticum]|uniref:Paraquat-inducible protein B n=1 Tax=Photobacterium aphoticum TaxID=754436 RepID=A0A090QMU4_9GAMM|nr:paraquat-inducible protein B [Photobacterium aphoticum]
MALILAGWLVFKAVNEAGERIKIHFNDAAGLVAGRTTIRYQGLEVGIVRDVNLSTDLKSIYVEADIYPEAVRTLKQGTQFWLVKPKASITGISGLDASSRVTTLLCSLGRVSLPMSLPRWILNRQIPLWVKG